MFDAIENIFRPVTVAPSRMTGIVELSPCAALRPYIRCFWECDDKNVRRQVRIIPDCCADIIIPLYGNGEAQFVGVSDFSFMSYDANRIFGIRFYGWSVMSFLSDAPDKLLNVNIAASDVFSDFKATEKRIASASGTAERVDAAEKYLLGKLCALKQNNNMLNGIYYALINDCNVDINDIAMYCGVGKRTLERNFIDGCGISPKRAVELMRYQLLWQACRRADFDVPDCVYKFGFYDSAHLYNSFKKYHGLGIAEARNELFEMSQIYNTPC